MKTTLKSFAAIAAALVSLSSCEVERLIQEPEELTHTVSFIAENVGTKTTAAIDGLTVNYSWTTGDADRFDVYENGVVATKTEGILGEDGIMTLKATFAGESSDENTYVAILNKSNDAQIMSAESYDEDADILVSKPVTSFAAETGVKLQFSREVAIAKMTLKGLDAGEVVDYVNVASSSNIAGKYGIEGWTDKKKSLEVSSKFAMLSEGYKIVANESGEAVIYFTCIPQEEATFTVKVTAADGDTYTKVFGKSISLNQGDVTAFGVSLIKTPVYSSLASLAEGGKPTADGTYVTVSLSNEEITRFQGTTNRKGVYFNVGTQEIEIYCPTTACPVDWKVGGWVSGTIVNCKWLLYVSSYDGSETWELYPDNWSELSYAAPCENPVITLDGSQATITCATDGAKVYYTVGTGEIADPTEENSLYTTPVTLTEGQTIKAKAFLDGHKESGVVYNTYSSVVRDYILVESQLTDWRGDFLIAFSSSIFMDGSLAGGTSGVGKASTAVNPGLNLSSDEKIVSSTWGDKYYVTIEAINDDDLSKGYVIKSHSTTTPYFYYTQNKNGMSSTAVKSTAATYPITIEVVNSKDVRIKLGGAAKGAVLRYNNNSTSSGGQMFRYYKDGGQSAIYLYKKN